MRRALVVSMCAFLLAVVVPALAERPATFTARLEWVPIGGTERNDVAGEGTASAKLSGATLAITGKFSGMPAKVTGAKVRQGVATGARGRGIVVADLKVSGGATGTLSGEIQLTPEQAGALKAGQLYVEIYSEKGVPPDHSTLWGWFLP
jgi:hypothetical protein